MKTEKSSRSMPPIDPVLGKVLDLGRAANRDGGIYARLQEIREDLKGVTDPLLRETVRTEIERQLKASGVEPARAAGLAFATLKPNHRNDELAPDPTKPSLDARDNDLPRISGLAWQALVAANDPPRLFRQGPMLCRLENAAEPPPVLRPLNDDRLRHELARAAHWVTITKEGVWPALPPVPVVKDMLADPRPPLPRAPRIVGAPVFSAQGKLIASPGYHPDAAIYYAPAPDLVVPPILERPSGDEIARARAMLCDELLSDFPFDRDAERTHALSFLLLPFLRDLINGPTPLHLFEKPTPGTGASLLVEVLVHPASGHSPTAMTAGRDEDEWRKRITAKLSSGAAFVLIDNVGRRLESDALSSAITAAVWEDRLLGSTQMLSIPVRCAWAATANNARLSNELARRTVRCRLDAKMERPWERKVFRHNLPEWSAQHRVELIWAALVLIQAWLAQGRPDGLTVLGGFESWSRVIGGVLSVAGIPGFLGNMEELYEHADVEGAENRRLVSAWWKKHGTAEVGVDTLFSLATSDEVNLGLSSNTERGQRMQLGHRLSSVRDRRYILTDDPGEFIVRVASGGVRHSTGRWHLALEGGVSPQSPPRPPQQSGEPGDRSAA